MEKLFNSFHKILYARPAFQSLEGISASLFQKRRCFFWLTQLHQSESRHVVILAAGRSLSLKGPQMINSFQVTFVVAADGIIESLLPGRFNG